MSEPAAVLDAVRRFVATQMHCNCYNAYSMEYGPEPCDKCRLEALVNGADVA